MPARDPTCATFAQIDTLLAPYRTALGADFQGYRNHCQRVANFCAARVPPSDDSAQKIAITAAFHDSGIWTNHTWDYLAPSAQNAASYLQKTGQSGWVNEICEAITQHHKITPYRGGSHALIDAFRRADTTDLSLGLLRFGLPKHFVRQVRQTFPNAGFHKTLLRLSRTALRKTPTNPMPMLKW